MLFFFLGQIRQMCQMCLAQRELVGPHSQFFEQARHARADQHAFRVLAYNDAGNRNAFIALIFVPGDQFVLTKLRLKHTFLLHLNHCIKTSYPVQCPLAGGCQISVR